MTKDPVTPTQFQVGTEMGTIGLGPVLLTYSGGTPAGVGNGRKNQHRTECRIIYRQAKPRETSSQPVHNCNRLILSGRKFADQLLSRIWLLEASLRGDSRFSSEASSSCVFLVLCENSALMPNSQAKPKTPKQFYTPTQPARKQPTMNCISATVHTAVSSLHSNRQHNVAYSQDLEGKCPTGFSLLAAGYLTHAI